MSCWCSARRVIQGGDAGKMPWCEVEGRPCTPTGLQIGNQEFSSTVGYTGGFPGLELLFRDCTQVDRLLIFQLHAMQMLAMSGVAPSYILLRSSRIRSEPLINDISPHEWSV